MTRFFKSFNTVDYLFMFIYIAYLSLANWYDGSLLTSVAAIACTIGLVGLVFKGIYFSGEKK
ncbi:hypothetical protein [Alkalicoccobacillus plakortidis]|uniref:Uncharacterized protein n=1 Tax=Alkalicoccobacillus plakortidis TaxID=444060 RepID=A0ABT0XFH9_9BACI|nr:hypothetical protein [Alkalicoccobacillus plakortidis]MCM2674113.1 hypothetical protein [Alkalicoccobacillus plakortidis]